MSEVTRRVSLAHLTLITTPPLELVAVAAETGFDGVGLRLVPTSHGVDHQLLGNIRDLEAVRRAADESGVAIFDVEVIRLREPERTPSPAAMVEAAVVLGAKWIITTVEDPQVERHVDSFAALCAEAAEHRIGISLEFMSFSAVPTLFSALNLIDASSADNAAVLVDALHLERSGGTPADLARVPQHRLAYVQLCDAAGTGAQPDPVQARAEAVTARLLPGDGSLPLAELVNQLPLDAVISVEAPLGGPEEAVDVRERAAKARAATATVLDMTRQN